MSGALRTWHCWGPEVSCCCFRDLLRAFSRQWIWLDSWSLRCKHSWLQCQSDVTQVDVRQFSSVPPIFLRPPHTSVILVAPRCSPLIPVARKMAGFSLGLLFPRAASPRLPSDGATKELETHSMWVLVQLSTSFPNLPASARSPEPSGSLSFVFCLEFVAASRWEAQPSPRWSFLSPPSLLPTFSPCLSYPSLSALSEACPILKFPLREGGFLILSYQRTHYCSLQVLRSPRLRTV